MGSLPPILWRFIRRPSLTSFVEELQLTQPPVLPIRMQPEQSVSRIEAEEAAELRRIAKEFVPKCNEDRILNRSWLPTSTKMKLLVRVLPRLRYLEITPAGGLPFGVPRSFHTIEDQVTYTFMGGVGKDTSVSKKSPSPSTEIWAQLSQLREWVSPFRPGLHAITRLIQLAPLETDAEGFATEWRRNVASLGSLKQFHNLTHVEFPFWAVEWVPTKGVWNGKFKMSSLVDVLPPRLEELEMEVAGPVRTHNNGKGQKLTESTAAEYFHEALTDIARLLHSNCQRPKMFPKLRKLFLISEPDSLCKALAEEIVKPYVEGSGVSLVVEIRSSWRPCFIFDI
ncbi:hypothetical protein BDZ91DRAFT_763902 [Kalaharituber pfeilii]|nr:hypothetical protein BDZ91DRAFT_763902 [Kalaharituber pfeilii]